MEKIQIPENIQKLVYSKFVNLPLKHKLVIYAKLVHGGTFKSQNNDLFELNKRTSNKIFKAFLDSIKGLK